MNASLWVGQGMLAVVFASSGGMKATRSKEWLLASGQTGVRDLRLPAIRAVAACELAAAFGLLAPWSSGILRGLTPAAAAGLAVVMVGAARIHTRLHEPRNVAINVVLFTICLAVCLGRLTELGR